ncbi:histidine phosphatase family protein [Bdellovibrio sp. HCB290]|uniref:histidine phosphatase family protein n=1 Tax=Bdellovibrio sp. HCB290 TaxID=3394356 RepID=UPI0039B68B9C
MAVKTIVLVRHGQYISASEKEVEKLTALGRKQAVYAAKRLKEFKIDRIVHSSMPRAVETAYLIRKSLGYKKSLHSCHSLRECLPGFPKSLRKKFGHTDTEKMKADEKQLDRAFTKYFKATRKDSVEVLICHGNVIRYLVCKVLGINTLAWRTMDIKQCGITIVEIRSKGTNRRVLISHNEVGHIPKDLRTFL